MKPWTLLSLGLLLGACNQDEVPIGSGAGGSTLNQQDSGADAADDGLPDTFGDCDGASVCDVSLGAFTKDPSAIPYCPGTIEEALAALGCGDWLQVSAGACGDLYSIRFVYGPPGDFFQCVYDAAGGALVGASWSPDNHPRQNAGTLPPDSCSLDADPCAVDGGTLPDSFGDCDGGSVCEVSLAAFTKNPGAIPYCEASRSAALAALACTSGMSITDGTCGDLYSIRYVYGPPGDYYQCVYNDSLGQLVGAIWAPDNHPMQVAGTRPPADCQLGNTPCPDAGAADAATE